MTTAAAHPLLIAVSGGIDSVVLLDMLVKTGRPLVVAHVNHGIRADSDEDETFVEQRAALYGVPFVSVKLTLGQEASEDTARKGRYAWLEEQRARCGASAIATAHHQDDVIETIIINLIRGTGWRGLCSLRETSLRYRPLLAVSKAEIIAYALEHQLTWCEDSTNESFRYLRNRIRHVVVPRLTPSKRQALISLYESQCTLRSEIAEERKKLIDAYCASGRIKRYPLIMATDHVSRELLRGWLGESLEGSRMRDLLIFAKTAKPGARWSLDGGRFIQSDADRLVVLSRRD